MNREEGRNRYCSAGLMAAIGLAYCSRERCAGLVLYAMEVVGRGWDDLWRVTGRLGDPLAVRHSRAVLFSTLEF